MLKEKNEQLLKDLRTSKINFTTYKTCLESVEARILVYKKNKSIYEEDIKLLKCEIHLREVSITDLRRKLELAQKQKDEIQLTVLFFENSSKNLSKLLDCQILDKYKIGLGYNVVPPPYTGKFFLPKPDLSGLKEFLNESKVSEPTVKKPVSEISEAKASADKPKVERKNFESQVSDKSKVGLGYKGITPDSFVNSSEILEKQENRSNKEYHAVPPPFTGNYMPPKRDLRLIDEHFERVSLDFISNIAPTDVKTVKTIDVNHKGVFNTKEPKPVMKNNFSPPIIEDWHLDDESEVEISPIVEVKIVKPSIEKIKFV
nr:hypothetical protein [Tanacetum cinerariifolium]